MSAYQYDMEPADVLVSGDLAVVHCIVRNTWSDTSGTHWQTRSYTEVDRKEEGKWLIWHEHASGEKTARAREVAEYFQQKYRQCLQDNFCSTFGPIHVTYRGPGRSR